MKKALGVFLALVLILALLPASALGADRVVLSPQRLCADGVVVDCEKYNIGGYNYFKLRDIAMLLKDTGSRFSVDYDTERRLVTVVTGAEYVPAGGELDTSRGDLSATARPSSQTILVDGTERSDLSVYNIGDVNFLRFRDLGRVLGFRTEYEGETDTAVIVSKRPLEPTPWRIQEHSYSANDGRWSRSRQEYDADGRLLGSSYETETNGGSTTRAYDELGRETETRSDYWTEYNGGILRNSDVTTYTYNLRGQLVEQRTEEDGEFSYSTAYTYDDRGNVLTRRYETPDSATLVTNTYDENGLLIRETQESDYGTYSTDYLRDGEGNILREWSTYGDGSVGYSLEYTYENGRKVKMVSTYEHGGAPAVTTYAYDEAGNCVLEREEADSYTTEIRQEYDDQGRLVKYVSLGNNSSSATTYVYDEAGNLLREEAHYEGKYYEEGGTTYVTEYTYDDRGNLLTEYSNSWNSVSETTYTYDEAAGKKSSVTVTTYPYAEELFLGEESLTLLPGDEHSLSLRFSPYNSAKETITWSSSDESVAVVDGEGRLTAMGPGRAVITATADESGLTAACAVTVQAEKYAVTVEPARVALRKGQSVTVTVTLSYAGDWVPVRLAFANDSPEKIRLEWDSAGWDGLTTKLRIQGLETGTASFRLLLRDDAGEQIGTAVTVKVTVVQWE